MLVKALLLLLLSLSLSLLLLLLLLLKEEKEVMWEQLIEADLARGETTVGQFRAMARSILDRSTFVRRRFSTAKKTFEYLFSTDVNTCIFATKKLSASAKERGAGLSITAVHSCIAGFGSVIIDIYAASPIL